MPPSQLCALKAFIFVKQRIDCSLCPSIFPPPFLSIANSRQKAFLAHPLAYITQYITDCNQLNSKCRALQMALPPCNPICELFPSSQQSQLLPGSPASPRLMLKGDNRSVSFFFLVKQVLDKHRLAVDSWIAVEELSRKTTCCIVEFL